tara:strand:- start:202 stop:1251 length:1050 start_codon:yes stop_codon:yes gene_type:complete
MSLVNDVLRQLETNNSQPYKGMPLQPLMATETVERNKWIHFSFLALIVFLLIIISVQVFYENSALLGVSGYDVVAPLQTKNITPELTRIVVPEITQTMAPVSKPSSMKNELPETLPIITPIVSPEQRVENTEILVSDFLQHESANHKPLKQEFVNKEPVNKEPVQHEALNQISTISVDNSLSEEANITTVKNAGFKHYQLALRAYKQKYSEVALTWINLALSEEPKEKYLRFKVRILMQQGLGNEIYTLAIEQANNTNLSWFELIAPSLQMYAFYELSNKYYAELIKQQPNETKWQLAMALNYSKLGKKDRTIAMYQNLLTSTLLTYRQKKWITSRLEKMNPSEVAVYE